MTTKVHGLRETVRSLERLGVEAQDLKAGFRRIGNIVVAEAKVLVPVRTGRLLNTIKASNTKNKSVVRAGSARAPYAGVIHYGGYHNIEPHPYLTTATDHKRSQVIQALDEELNTLMNRLDLN